MTLVTMSKQEFSRVAVLQDLQAGRVGVDEAAALLGVTRRQVFRLQKAFLADGPAGLASRRRGRPGNRRTPDPIRRQVISIIRERYADFGPTLAAEKLAQHHGLSFSRETLRLWMVAEGLWRDRKERLKAVHQPRRRRDCVGELVQIDGSEHWWFEGRGPQCTLLVFVDDATSRLMALRFVETESAFAYFAATREYLERHGRPVAFYSDKHSVFRVNKPGAVGGGHDAVRALPARTQHRHPLRQHPTGQGARGTRQQNAAGPPGQGAAPPRRRHSCGGQCDAAGLHGGLQRPLRQGAG